MKQIKLVAVKNSKNSYDCLDWAIVRETGAQPIALIVRFPEKTYRRAHQGSNSWDVFTVITLDVALDCVEGISGHALGRYNGNDTCVGFTKPYTSEIGNSYVVTVGTTIEWISESYERLFDFLQQHEIETETISIYSWGGDTKINAFAEVLKRYKTVENTPAFTYDEAPAVGVNSEEDELPKRERERYNFKKNNKMKNIILFKTNTALDVELLEAYKLLTNGSTATEVLSNLNRRIDAPIGAKKRLGDVLRAKLRSDAHRLLRFSNFQYPRDNTLRGGYLQEIETLAATLVNRSPDLLKKIIETDATLRPVDVRECVYQACATFAPAYNIAESEYSLYAHAAFEEFLEFINELYKAYYNSKVSNDVFKLIIDYECVTQEAGFGTALPGVRVEEKDYYRFSTPERFINDFVSRLAYFRHHVKALSDIYHVPCSELKMYDFARAPHAYEEGTIELTEETIKYCKQKLRAYYDAMFSPHRGGQPYFSVDEFERSRKAFVDIENGERRGREQSGLIEYNSNNVLCFTYASPFNFYSFNFFLTPKRNFYMLNPAKFKKV